MIRYWKTALGAGAVIAAGVAATPAAAEEKQTYRSEHPASGEYRTYYDQQGRVYITTSDPDMQRDWSARGERREPAPMRYERPSRVTTETDYDWVYGVDHVDETGRYRVEYGRDRDTDIRFRSSAGTQSPSSTRRWYGPQDDIADRNRITRESIRRDADYGVYGIERDDRIRSGGERWQREGQGQYDARYDRRGDVEIRYDDNADITRYERQRIEVQPRDRDVDVRYWETSRERPPVPMRYESQYLPPRREVRLEDQTYGVERRTREDVSQPRYDNRNMREGEFRRDWDSERVEYEASPLDRRSYPGQPQNMAERFSMQPEDFEYRTEGGWYYDEDTGTWLRVPDTRARINQDRSLEQTRWRWQDDLSREEIRQGRDRNRRD